MATQKTSDAITIRVTAQTSKKPDEVKLDVRLYDELDERNDCIEQYNKDLNAVITALEKAGINKADIKQSGFKVYPHKESVYEKVGDDEDDFYYRAEVIKGYEYESHASVLMDADEKIFGNAWLALLETDGSFTFEFNFGLKDEDAVEKELLEEAVHQAQERAKALADAADIKLGKVMAIEHSVRSDIFSFEEDLSYFCRETRMSAPHHGKLIPDFNPDDITVSCSIEIAWHID